MDRIEIKCSHCSYVNEVLIGSVTSDQTLSDVNEDFACYKLHKCPVGKEILSLDIHDREFDGKCPVHNVNLEPLDSVPESCPKCGNKLHVTEKEILETRSE